MYALNCLPFQSNFSFILSFGVYGKYTSATLRMRLWVAVDAIMLRRHDGAHVLSESGALHRRRSPRTSLRSPSASVHTKLVLSHRCHLLQTSNMRCSSLVRRVICPKRICIWLGSGLGLGLGLELG